MRFTISSAMILACFVSALGQGVQAKGPETGRRPKPVVTLSITARLDKFAKEFSLTPIQKSKVKQIVMASNAKLHALAMDNKMKELERRKRIRAIAQASQSQIRSVLDAKQRIKFDAKAKEEGARRAKPMAPSRPPVKKPQ